MQPKHFETSKGAIVGISDFAKVGASPEAKAAWDKLTPEQQDEARKKVSELVAEAAKIPIKIPQRDPIQLNISFNDAKYLLY